MTKKLLLRIAEALDEDKSVIVLDGGEGIIAYCEGCGDALEDEDECYVAYADYEMYGENGEEKDGGIALLEKEYDEYGRADLEKIILEAAL